MPDITEQGRRVGWPKRLAWFALLYLAGLAAVGVVAWLLRAWLG